MSNAGRSDVPTNGKEGNIRSRKRDSGIGGIDGGMGYGHSTSAKTDGGGMNPRGVKNDGRYTSDTNGTMGMSRGYDNARSNNSTIPIPVSDVRRDSVLHASPGVKESNSNLAPYMIDRGGVGSYGGAIPGTGYSTGSGTRTYAAPRENNGLSPYTQDVNEDPSRPGPSEHRAGGAHIASNPKGRLSYSRDTASELGLGPSYSSSGDNRPYHAGDQHPGNRDYSAREASPSTSQNVADAAASAASYVGDTATGAATYAGDAAIGAGSYMADTAKSAVSAIKPMETTANVVSYVGDTAASAGSFIADTVSAMKPMEKAANAASYVGDTTVNAGSYMVDTAKEMRPMDTAANAASYMADTVRSVAPPAGPSSNIQAETTPVIYDRNYSPGDTPGYDSRTYDSSDRAPITQKVADTAANAASYVADTAKDLASGIGLTSGTVPSTTSTSDAVARGYDVGTGIGFGSGNKYNAHQARSRGMPGSFDDSHSNSYNITGMDGGGPRRANSVSYRGGAYLSGHDSQNDATVRMRETPWNAGRDGDRLRRESLDRDRIKNDQREYERVMNERMERNTEREPMDRERMDRERNDPNRMGARPERRRSLGERYVITRDNDVAMLDPSSQREPAMSRIYEAGVPRGGTPRDDASCKAERLRQELEKEMQETQTEALRLARERDTREAIGGNRPQKVVSPGQKYSSLVSQDPGSLDSKRGGGEEAGHIPGAFENPIRSEAINAQEARRNNPLGANLELQQAERERESERSARRSSMDRHRATDTGHGSGPGGMMTTMRDDPEYRDQKQDDDGHVVTNEKQREQDVREKIQSQFEGDDDDETRRKSLLGRAASKMGNLLKA